jgi:hypothetical protein
MGALAGPIGLAGTAISAIGAISSGGQQAAEATYQSQVAANNAIIAGQNANYATAAGETTAYNTGLQERAKAGAIKAGIAAGGIDVNSGSAAQVRESQDVLGLTDVEQVRQNAALQAYGFRTQATSYEAQSQLEKQEAGYDTEAGWLKGIGSLIGGGAQFAGGSGINSLTNLFNPTVTGSVGDANLQSWGVESGANNPYPVTP